MRTVRQQTPNGCGAAAVATLVGITWRHGVKAVGTDGITTASDLRRALLRYGVRLGRLRRLRKGVPPERCIVHICYTGRQHGHWLVHEKDGRVRDPGGSYDYLPKPSDLTTVSYLPVENAYDDHRGDSVPASDGRRPMGAGVRQRVRAPRRDSERAR